MIHTLIATRNIVLNLNGCNWLVSVSFQVDICLHLQSCQIWPWAWFSWQHRWSSSVLVCCSWLNSSTLCSKAIWQRSSTKSSTQVTDGLFLPWETRGNLTFSGSGTIVEQLLSQFVETILINPLLIYLDNGQIWESNELFTLCQHVLFLYSSNQQIYRIRLGGWRDTLPCLWVPG